MMSHFFKKIGRWLAHVIDWLWKGFFVYILLIIMQVVINGIFEFDDAINTWGRVLLWLILGIVGQGIWRVLPRIFTPDSSANVTGRSRWLDY